MIYRFILFTEWQPSVFAEDSDTFTIGIVGDSPFNSLFGQLAKRQVNNRKLVIRSLSSQSSPKDLRGCQVIFIPSSHADQVKQIFNEVADSPVVTISDIEGFLEMGGMIGLFSEKNRIKFAIHRTRASRVGIHFRGQMLKMAAQVLE